MKILKWIIIVLGGILGIILLVALFLPSETSVQTKEEINVEPGALFHSVAKFNNRTEWDPWLTMEPTAEVKINSKEGYVGSTYEWDGEKIGNGKMEVVDATYPNHIVSHIWFGTSSEPSVVDWKIEKSGTGSEVTWKFITTGKYPFGRIMIQLIKGSLEKSFSEGLENLKTFMESNPPVLYELTTIGIDESYDTWALVLPAAGSMEEIGRAMMQGFPALMNEVQEQQLSLNGPAFAHYLDYDPETDYSNVLLAFPVKSEGERSGEIYPKFYEKERAVVATHLGKYEYFDRSYAAMEKYISDNDIEVTGEAYEVYLTTMMDTQNPMELKTMIAFPIKEQE